LPNGDNFLNAYISLKLFTYQISDNANNIQPTPSYINAVYCDHINIFYW